MSLMIITLKRVKFWNGIFITTVKLGKYTKRCIRDEIQNTFTIIHFTAFMTYTLTFMYYKNADTSNIKYSSFL